MSAESSRPKSLEDSSLDTILNEALSLGGNTLSRFVWRGLDISHQSKKETQWSLSSLTGRVVELSGHRALANLTVAFGLVREAQSLQEPVGWVTLLQSCFYPPDVDEAGVELGDLAVVRLGDIPSATRAAVQLVRSGGFGLVVLDFGPPALAKIASQARSRQNESKQRFYRSRRYAGRQRLASPMMTQLVGLAQKYDTAVILLTEKPSRQASLSSLVSVRAEVSRDPENISRIDIKILKDKRRGPGRSFRESCHAPAGLR